MFSNGLSALARNPSSNVLIIYGDEDNFTGVSQYHKWVADLRKESKGHLEVREIAGADHFWRGETGDELCRVIIQWLIDLT